MPKRTPSLVNVPGTARAATNIAAIAPSSARSAEPSSGSISFVSQAYAPDPQQGREDEEAPAQPGPGEVVGHQPGHLRDREHEDQVTRCFSSAVACSAAPLGGPGVLGARAGMMAAAVARSACGKPAEPVRGGRRRVR
jgi:hypothetical protein